MYIAIQKHPEVLDHFQFGDVIAKRLMDSNPIDGKGVCLITAPGAHPIQIKMDLDLEKME